MPPKIKCSAVLCASARRGNLPCSKVTILRAAARQSTRLVPGFRRQLINVSKQQCAHDLAMTFTGSTESELRGWLAEHQSGFSEQPSSGTKTMHHLMDEIQAGESQLLLREDGSPVRCVSVLVLHIHNSLGQVLVEDHQVRPDGMVRRRGVLLSEKLQHGEDWQIAVPRAVKEELGSVLEPDVRIDYDVTSYRCSREDSDSHSYPGLPCQYRTCHVDVTVSGLPEQGSFMTKEKRGTGFLQNHWAWVDPANAPMHKP